MALIKQSDNYKANFGLTPEQVVYSGCPQARQQIPAYCYQIIGNSKIIYKTLPSNIIS